VGTLVTNEVNRNLLEQEGSLGKLPLCSFLATRLIWKEAEWKVLRRIRFRKTKAFSQNI